MHIFKGKNPNAVYHHILQSIIYKGINVSPRGKNTKELYPCYTTITNPQERMLFVGGRNYNPYFLVAEILWILSGRGDRQFIEHYIKKFSEYSDFNWQDYNAPYGVRMRNWGQLPDLKCMRLPDSFRMLSIDQLEEAYSRLVIDKDTRQSCISLWNPYQDTKIGLHDYPCNNMSYFKIRDNKLHLHQILRSNDFMLGLFPTNMYQWSIIHELMSGFLGIELGEISFFSDSLHLYEDDFNTAKVMNIKSKQKSSIDVYNHYKPKSISVPYNQLDRILSRLIDIEGGYRDGRFTLKRIQNIPEYWNDISKTLLAYNLRKEKRYEDSVKVISKIKTPDLLIALLQYNYYNSSDLSEITLINNVCEKLKIPEKIKEYITHDSK